jgi:flagellar biosynthesis protein FliR
MDELLRELGFQGELSQGLLVVTLIVSRTIPIIFQTPFLGGKLVPMETRIGLAVGLSALVYPFARGSMSGPLDTNGVVFIVLMMKELFIGFIIGFVASELFVAMEIGGRGLDTLRGSNMAEVQVPELQLRISPTGMFGFQLLLVIFCVLDGFGHFIESVLESFRVVPIDAWPTLTIGLEELAMMIVTYTSSLFGIAFALVFPGMFAAFITDVVFGMFNRVAPQLNAYFMAMGIKAMGGIAMFMFALSMMSSELSIRLEDSLLFVRRLIMQLN